MSRRWRVVGKHPGGWSSPVVTSRAPGASATLNSERGTVVESETATAAEALKSTRTRFQRARDARLWTFGLALAVTGLDQVVKLVVDAVLPVGGADIGPVFSLQRVSNPGINFGLLRDHPILILYATIAIGVTFAIYVALRPPRRWWPVAGFALLLGGAFGNVADRIRLGAVFDYLNITPFIGFLNLADLAIGAGFIVLIIDSLRGPRAARERPVAEKSDPAPTS